MYILFQTEQMNVTIKFTIFRSVLAPRFILHKYFLFFGPFLLKKSISL